MIFKFFFKINKKIDFQINKCFKQANNIFEESYNKKLYFLNIISLLYLQQSFKQKNQIKKQLLIIEQNIMINTQNNDDISKQINRILSTNIDQDFLKSLKINAINSPLSKSIYRENNVIRSPKLNQNIENSSQRLQLSRHSLSRVNSNKFIQVEQDFYHKAQQILQLKEMLQSELTNINQLINQNQKITQENQNLLKQIKILKIQHKKIQSQLLKQIKQQEKQNLEIKEKLALKQEIIQKLINKKHQLDKHRDLTITEQYNFRINSFQKDYYQKQVQTQNYSFQIQSQYSQILYPLLKINTKSQLSDKLIQTQQQPQSISQNNKQIKLLSEISSLKSIISQLKIQNTQINNKLNDKIKILSQISQGENISKRQTQTHKQNKIIDCYTSIFLQSLSDEQQYSQQNLRNIIFNTQRPFFQYLQQSKYEGRIVLGMKYGQAKEIYRNEFIYQGNFLKNLRYGTGKLSYKDKLIYNGQWKNGKFQGKGILFIAKNKQIESIEGNFKNGNLQGYCTVRFKQGQKLRVIFKENQMIYNKQVQKYDKKNDQTKKNQLKQKYLNYSTAHDQKQHKTKENTIQIIANNKQNYPSK